MSGQFSEKIITMTNRRTLYIVALLVLLVFLVYYYYLEPLAEQLSSARYVEDLKTKKNFLFAKTHKTGSSTLGSIFFYYGMKRKLNFVLPPYTNTLRDVDETYVKKLLPPRSGEKWNIQVQHCRFYQKFQHLVLPKESTVYTTVTRSPISHFKSTFLFFGHEARLRKVHGNWYSFDDLVNIHLDQTCHTLLIDEIDPIRYLCLEMNNIAIDLGWIRFTESFNHLSIQERIDAFINMLDEEMDLVMITDRMDESLVVLKELIGWEMSDILYLDKKVTEKKTNTDITEKTSQRLLQSMDIDRQIFEFFNRKFDKHVENLGKAKIATELQQFKALRQYFEDNCFDKKLGPKPVCVNCPNPNLGRTITWELSEYGKTENLACSFLHTDFRLYSRAISDLVLSKDYTDPQYTYLQPLEDRELKVVIEKMYSLEKKRGLF